MLTFAFSTLSSPTCDLVTTAGRALEWGFDGVELAWAAGGPERLGSVAGEAAVAEPGKAREILAAGQIRIACLAANVAFSGRSPLDDKRADKVRLAIEAAREMGAPFVKILDAPRLPGVGLGDLGLQMGDWLLPLGDYARDRGVALVVENALGFRRAADLWTVMDRLDHPAIGCAWNVRSAFLAGESPGVSVSVLNSRIRYAIVPASEDDTPVRPFIHRLRGIGFRGWVGVTSGGDDLTTAFPAAVKALKNWASPPLAAKTTPKPASKTIAARG